jgi:hypothetical protein
LSLDLTIPCPKPFRAVELTVYSERAIQDLLDLTVCPVLRVWQKHEDRDVFMNPSEEVRAGLPPLGLGLEGVEESIQMTYFRLEQASDWTTPGDLGPQVGLEAGDEKLKWGGAVRLALGAGVALGLARFQGTTIIDKKLSLTKQERLSEEEFLQALKVRGPFDEFRNAAEAFLQRTSFQALDGLKLQILQIEREMDGMLMDLLAPLRMSQTVDRKAFQRFFLLADDWLHLAARDRDLMEKLESLLVLVREFLLDECRKAGQPQEITRAAGEVELRLGKLRAHNV